MSHLFYDLIRVSIGAQDTLSSVPSGEDWRALYAIAKKQSLIGICFAGVQMLYNNANQKHITKNLDETLYLTWMGMAAKIQQRNENVSQACKEVCEMVSSDVFECCVLKGQSNLAFYPEHLQGSRMPGDIDLLVWKKSQNGEHQISEVIRYARRLKPDTQIYYHHADINKARGVDVELHYRPTWMSAPWRNRRLQRWAQSNAPGGGSVASAEFNAVYQLVHIYRHLFSEGVGLRQLLDYYFVLQALSSSFSPAEHRIITRRCIDALDSFGMRHFSAAVMCVLQKVFAMPQEYLLCEPDAKKGEFLLREIMLSGNFGQFDSRNYKTKADGALGWGWMKLKRNIRFLWQYPEEVLFEPFFRVYHWVWRKFIVTIL